MDAKDLLTLYFERSNALETLWTIYITVAGALLGFCATRRSVGLNTMLVISTAFVLFAVASYSGVRETASTRYIVYTTLAAAPHSKGPCNPGPDLAVCRVVQTLDPTPPTGATGILAFHIVFDALTLGALWIVGYRRLKKKNPSPSEVRGVARTPLEPAPKSK